MFEDVKSLGGGVSVCRQVACEWSLPLLYWGHEIVEFSAIALVFTAFLRIMERSNTGLLFSCSLLYFSSSWEQIAVVIICK